MISTTQTVTIDRPIADVWAFARHIEGWAQLMPGLQSCEEIDADHSRWVLKVGAGGMVRTVTVLVHVEHWDEPGGVRFSYTLDKDPVEGRGTYAARALEPGRTEVELSVEVSGSGPMAPMWEAMGKPLLPKLAAGFAAEFKQRLEASQAPVAGAPAPTLSLLARLVTLLRRLFSRASAG